MTTHPKSQKRRKFLFVILGGIGSFVGVAATWPLFRYLSPRKVYNSGDTVSVSRDSVVLGKAYFFQFRGKTAVVLQLSPGNFVALSAVCTHLGCVVAWQEQAGEFLCPCHGGRFSAEGQVLGGPPPRPLETFDVTLEGDQLRIG